MKRVVLLSILLEKNIDYTVSAKNNIEVADEESQKVPTVVVTCKGKYSGVYTENFKIVPANLSKVEDISVEIKDCMYTGKEIMPVVSVKKGKTVLQNKKDYTLTFKNNIEPGTASVTITGIGNYKGSITEKFSIFAKGPN